MDNKMKRFSGNNDTSDTRIKTEDLSLKTGFNCSKCYYSLEKSDYHRHESMMEKFPMFHKGEILFKEHWKIYYCRRKRTIHSILSRCLTGRILTLLRRFPLVF